MIHSAWKSGLVWALALTWLVVFPKAASAGDKENADVLKLKAQLIKAQLIWGTNEDKSPDPKHRELEPRLKKRLQGVFKWKSYFEVNQQTFSVAPKKTRKIKLSPQCEVEVTNLGNNQIEAKLYGEGEFQVRKRQTLKKGEIFSLAGHAKNGTAWFVVFSQVED